jgi:hypothetical protein
MTLGGRPVNFSKATDEKLRSLSGPAPTATDRISSLGNRRPTGQAHRQKAFRLSNVFDIDTINRVTELARDLEERKSDEGSEI